MNGLYLPDLIRWMEDEWNQGNRVKASKLRKMFHKYARLQHPYVTEEQLINYRKYYWASSLKPKR